MFKPDFEGHLQDFSLEQNGRGPLFCKCNLAKFITGTDGAASEKSLSTQSDFSELQKRK